LNFLTKEVKYITRVNKIDSHIEHSSLRRAGSKENVIGKAFKIS
jgi:hypothetical protein